MGVCEVPLPGLRRRDDGECDCAFERERANGYGALKSEKAAVDALIPWLLQEDAQLRGIPFSEVIFDSTGKHVLACNPKDETNARVLKQMSSVLDEVMARLNAPESPIQGIPRINEVSSHFE